MGHRLTWILINSFYEVQYIKIALHKSVTALVWQNNIGLAEHLHVLKQNIFYLIFKSSEQQSCFKIAFSADKTITLITTSKLSDFALLK